MQAKINQQLLARLEPKAKPYEVYDSELKGFTLRVQPSGIMSYLVRYRRPDRRQTRYLVGRHPVLTPAQARDEARKVLADVVRDKDPSALRAEARTVAREHTLGSFVTEEYAPWALEQRKDGEATVSRLRACFAEFEAKKLSELNAWIFEKWRTARLKEGRAPATVNRDIDALKAALAKAVEWEMLAEHPLAKKLNRIKVDNARARYLSEDEEARLYRALDQREERMREERERYNAWRRSRGYPEFPSLRKAVVVDHLKPMVLISLHTGLRQGELFQLEWSSVDFVRKQLTVEAHTAKAARRRHIPLNDDALAMLKVWRGRQQGAGLVFPNAAGRAFDNVQSAWENVLRQARIDDFRWHDLRHHFASQLVMEGVDLNTVRELLGHADITMTLRYAHLAPEHKAQAVAKLMHRARTITIKNASPTLS